MRGRIHETRVSFLDSMINLNETTRITRVKARDDFNQRSAVYPSLLNTPSIEKKLMRKMENPCAIEKKIHFQNCIRLKYLFYYPRA